MGRAVPDAGRTDAGGGEVAMTAHVLRALSRVNLTAAAAARFPDIGTREGVVLRVDGWPVVKWRGLEMECRIEPSDLVQAEASGP